MHKDEKEPKETLGEKVKDKAHEIKENKRRIVVNRVCF